MRPMHNDAEPLTIGVDIGGTFTDVAMLTRSGAVHTAKAATTPADPARGVIDALASAASRLGTDLSGLLARAERITHGSTIATNALLTRKGARLGLITTRGFEDTPFIMRAIGRVDGLPEEEVRHVAYLCKPEPLVPRTRVLGVTERIDVNGRVVVPLDETAAARVIERLVEVEGVEGLAVCLLNSWANPAHEDRIAQLVAANGGDRVYATYSNKLARVAGEYARTNTALADAFVGPIVTSYLRSLERELRERGFRGHFLLMQGNGGVASAAECAPVATLQSGPAGGMLATAHMAALLGHDRVLTADMGGTSFDVGIYADGYWSYADEPIFDRFRILQPIIQVESIGAGGGTIARTEEATRRLVVGPESAGADPGPASYAQGGEAPTVTDANVVLGVIDPEYFLGGRKRLSPERASGALADRVARPLGIGVEDAAAGVVRIVEAKMADLMRRQVIRSGHRPEDFVLYAFGGATAIHAVALARELRIGRVYVFPSSPVFSALGVALADVRHTRLLTCRVPLSTDADELQRPIAALEAELGFIMEREGFAARDVTVRRYASIRYLRQTAAVEVELPAGRLDRTALQDLATRFARRYEALYGAGAGSGEEGGEVSALRVDAIGTSPKPALAAAPRASGAAKPKGTRRARLNGSASLTPIYEWSALRSGHRLAGPAIVESEFTTVVVPDRCEATVDAYGNVVLVSDTEGANSAIAGGRPAAHA
ncbi:MAG TPA: hydantoinase/oxoprolinase family protein [Candidatus Limnocylindria bacterium]|nr:hydantoinase/oxoprolinase family protein [Candidatus Limnocylindria bacterium]